MKKVQAGVPQWSTLKHLSILIYIQDINIFSGNLKLILYAGSEIYPSNVLINSDTAVFQCIFLVQWDGIHMSQYMFSFNHSAIFLYKPQIREYISMKDQQRALAQNGSQCCLVVV